MVKLSPGGKSSKTAALRVDMKRKLPLPPPFVVNRGYTPDYPWLGQDHPAPKPRRPRLLMQQSCSGAAKVALCLVAAVLGVALLIFAGTTIVRGVAERRAHDLGPHPQHAALMQEGPASRESFYEDILPDGADAFGDAGPEDEPADSPLIPLRIVDPVLPDDAKAAPSDATDEVAVEDVDVTATALKTTKHMLLMMRMANLVATQRELQKRVELTDALRGAYDQVQAAEAAMADDEGNALASAPSNEQTLSQQDDAPQAQLEDQADIQPEVNTEAQAEVQPEVQLEDLQTDAVDEDARNLLQWMLQAQPTQQEQQEPQPQEQPLQDTVDEDAPLLAQWMRQGQEAEQAQLQDDQRGDVQVDDHQDELKGDDAEAVRQILLWLTSSPQSWDVEQPEKVVSEERSDVLPTNKSSVDEAATTTVPWDQLNEDDRQDALLPKLAARGLDLQQEGTLATAAPTPVDALSGSGQGDSGSEEIANPQSSDEPTQVESDVAAVEPQGALHGAELHPEQEEAQQAQHYRHLVSQRFPLMYHVLNLRRSQQDALQQEQRATAYLHLLDLHLLQHRQEAEARRQQRQHQQEVQRLQQDEAQWARQNQWVQQQEQQAYQQGLQSDGYEQRRPARHLHGRVRHRHHHHRHQLAC